jgi:malonyl CoA-acyl carrier protein transacylase
VVVIVPRQILLVGTEKPGHELAARVGPGALGVKVLPVRWLLHTSLMKPVSHELAPRRAEVGELQPVRNPVYSAPHGGRIEDPLEGWRLLVEHLFRPQHFDRAFEAATGDGLVRCVELGSAGTLERRGVEVETLPGGAPDRVRERKAGC